MTFSSPLLRQVALSARRETPTRTVGLLLIKGPVLSSGLTLLASFNA